MSNELYAKYTETFNEFLKNNPTYLNDTISFGTTAQSTSLIEMITNVWNIYEISGETEDEFKIFFENTFNEFKDYYLDIINNYEKAFDYSTANKKVRILGETEGTKDNGTTARTTTDSAFNIKYDLPNKPTTEYPSNKITDTDNATDNSQYSSTKDKTKSTTDTTTYSMEYIKLKNEYLKQIKSYYYEFAMKFKDCFIHIY